MRLYYFTESEYHRDGENWWALMDPAVLVLLDAFRHGWGARVEISPHRRALGRRNWPNRGSDHAVDVRGAVCGADVMPEGLATRVDAERAVDLATDLCFTAVGLYPHWQPGAGLHLGRRDTHRPGRPALWGAIRKPNELGELVQTYVTLQEALEVMPR